MREVFQTQGLIGFIYLNKAQLINNELARDGDISTKSNHPPERICHLLWFILIKKYFTQREDNFLLCSFCSRVSQSESEVYQIIYAYVLPLVLAPTPISSWLSLGSHIFPLKCIRCRLYSVIHQARMLAGWDPFKETPPIRGLVHLFGSMASSFGRRQLLYIY